MIAQLILHVVLIFTVPISLMLVLNLFLNFGVIMPATHWVGFSTIAFSLFPFHASTQRM